MKTKLLIALSVLWVSGSASEELRVESHYGARTPCVGHLVVYPDFAIRFIRRQPHQRFTEYVFQVVNPSSGKSIMYFRFNMAGVYELPELRIGGSRYVVDLTPETDLTKSTLVIWDKASAVAKNPELFDWVWMNKRPKFLERGIIWQPREEPNSESSAAP